MTSLLSYNQAPGAPYTASQRAWLIAGAVLLTLFAALFAQHVLAATGGGSTGTGGGADILQSVYDLLQSAVTGTLGKVLTLLIVVVGIGIGIMSQSLLAFAVGVGAGIGLYFSPTIIDALFTAVVMPHAHVLPTAAVVLQPLIGG